MAIRVDAVELKDVVNTKISDDTLLHNHIVTANLIVEENLLGVGHSDAMLKRIELYLAAHYVAISDERFGLTRTQFGDGADSYSEDVYGMGYSGTSYGQMALTLDTSGTLASLGTTKPKALFRVV